MHAEEGGLERLRSVGPSLLVPSVALGQDGRDPPFIVVPAPPPALVVPATTRGCNCR